MRHSFQRQTVKHDESRDFMILTEPERRYFMSGIAAYMGAMGFPNQLTREHLDRSVRLLYEVIPSSVSSAGIGAPMESRMPLRLRLEGSDEPLQDIANDVRACGILVADQSRSGTFRFAHRSFLECLLASVLKDRILGFDKEATGAIIAATGLTTYDVARSQESLRFLAELLIDEAASPPSKETENPTVRAKRLFNVIVIRQMRPNFGKRIRATIGVWTMIARARQHDEVSGLPRFVIGWSMDPVGLPVTISILLSMPLLLSAAIRVSSVEMWIASVFIGMTFIVFGSATLLSRLSETNLQLWYACCASIGLAEQEIGAIIGLKWLSQVRYYVQDTFDRHTRHDNR